VRQDLDELDAFPQFDTEEKAKSRAINSPFAFRQIEERSEYEITVFGQSGSTRFSQKQVWSEVIGTSAARRESPGEGIASDKVGCVK